MLYTGSGSSAQYENCHVLSAAYNSPTTDVTLDFQATTGLPGINQTWTESSTYLYTIGMGVRFDNVTVTGARDTGDPGSQVDIEVTFSAGGGLSEAAVYWGVR